MNHTKPYIPSTTPPAVHTGLCSNKRRSWKAKAFRLQTKAIATVWAIVVIGPPPHTHTHIYTWHQVICILMQTSRISATGTTNAKCSFHISLLLLKEFCVVVQGLWPRVLRCPNVSFLLGLNVLNIVVVSCFSRILHCPMVLFFSAVFELFRWMQIKWIKTQITC